MIISLYLILNMTLNLFGLIKNIFIAFSNRRRKEIFRPFSQMSPIESEVIKFKTKKNLSSDSNKDIGPNQSIHPVTVECLLFGVL